MGMGPPYPPANIPPTHVVLWITPLPFSSTPIGLIHKDGTSFVSPYLMPLASLPGTTPGLPNRQHTAPSAAIYNLGGSSYVPGGSALRAPPPHVTPFMGPCCPEPEEDISAGSHLRHGVLLSYLAPSILQWRVN